MKWLCKKKAILGILTFLLVSAFFVLTPPEALAKEPIIRGIRTSGTPYNDRILEDMTIYGKRFATGLTVKLTKEGEADIIATNVYRRRSWQVICDVDLTGAAAGRWNVVVTNPSGESGTFYGRPEVVQAEPPPSVEVTGMHSDDTPYNDGLFEHVEIYGERFAEGLSAKLTKDGENDIPGINVRWNYSWLVICDFDLTGAAIGRWNVVVTNPDGASGTFYGRPDVREGEPPPPESMVASIEMSTLLSPVTAGTIQGVSVTAKDQYGEIATNYTGTVHFSTNDANPMTLLPNDYTFGLADNGTKVFGGATSGEIIRLTKATTNIYVKVEDVSDPANLYAEQTNITVNPDVEDRVVFTSGEQTVIAGTASDPINIELQDYFGNPTPAGPSGRTIYLSSDSSSSGGEPPSPTSGTTYYISSSSGNDANDGLLPETAFRTFRGANFNADGALLPGDQVLFKRGDEWIGFDADVEVNSAGTVDDYIIIGAYGEGDKPLFTGAIRTGHMPEFVHWTLHSGNIWVANTNPADHIDWWVYTVAVGEDRNLFNVGSFEYMYPGSFDHSYSNAKLYVWLEDGSDPNNKIIRVGKNTPGGHLDRGLIRTSYWGGKSGYVKFQNLHVRFANRQGFTSNDPYVEFHDCIATGNGRAGFDMIQSWNDPPGGQHNRIYRCIARWNNASRGQAFNTDALDTWFVDCLSEDNYMAGFDFLDYNERSEATGKMIRCVARYNGRNKRSNSWDPNIYVDGGHDIQIIDCEAYGAGNWSGANYQNGITIGTEHDFKPVYNIDIINCLSYDNRGYALSINAIADTTIDNVRVIGCTFAKGPTAYALLSIADLAGEGVELKNNIFYHPNNGTLAPWLKSPNVALIDSDNNVFYNTGNNIVKVDGVGYSLTEWQSAFNQDLYSIKADPLLVNTTVTDFDARLQRIYFGDPANSPAIDAADESPYPLSDYTDIGTTRSDSVSDEIYSLDIGYHYNAVYNLAEPEETLPGDYGFSLTGTEPWDLTSVIIPQGDTSIVIYYMDCTEGTHTMTVDDTNVEEIDPGLKEDKQDITIIEPII